MTGFAQAAIWRQAEARWLDACAMRAAFADDPKWLRDMRPDRHRGASAEETDDDIDEYLSHLGFKLDRS